MAHRVARQRGVAVGVTAVLALLAGCYSSTALGTVTPAPNTPVSLEFSDPGRVGAGVVFGPSVSRVEGDLVRATDSTYLLRIASVTDVRGVTTKWDRESVTVARSWVARTSERRFSRSRTYLIAGAFTAAVAAFIATRGFGSGGPVLPNSTSGGGGSVQ